MFILMGAVTSDAESPSRGQRDLMRWIRHRNARSALGVAALALVGFAFAVGNETAGLPTAVGVLLVTGWAGLTRQHRELEAQDSVLSDVLDSLNSFAWEEDLERDGVLIVSRHAVDVLGYPLECWHQPHFWHGLAHPSDGDRVLGDLKALELDPRSHHALVRLRHADGRFRWIEARAISVRGSDGRHVRFRGVMLDRTEEIEVGSARQRLADLVARSSVAHWVLECGNLDDPASASVITANRAGLHSMGIDRRSLSAGLVGFLGDGASPTEPRSPLRADHVFGPGTPLAIVPRLAARVCRDGEQRSVLVHDDETSSRVTVMPLESNAVGVSIEDVTEQLRSEAALKRQATTDILTGLANRAAISARLERLASSGQRRYSLLVLDLNQFKEVNDTLGHEVGDRLLAVVADRIRAAAVPHLVGRLGGDEFAVLVVDRPPADAHRLAAAIGAALDEPVALDTVELAVSASIGVASSPDDALQPAELLKRADIAMYRSKSQRLPWVHYDSGSDGTSVRRLALTGELRGAIARGEMHLVYQPIVDLDSLRPVGVEALARWAHPDYGSISPAEFIPMAEVSGTVRDLTRWLLDSAAGTARALAAIDPSMHVACNLSARNLYEDDLAAWLDETLDRHGVDRHMMCLELTETDVMDDAARTASVLQTFGAMGLSVAVDDFGTGYSSLAQLRDLPAQVIKIDRSFVARLVEQGSDATIVQSVVELAHELGRVVIAEGVEDEATLSALRSMGCDRAQGFHIARPMSRDDLFAYVRQWAKPESTGGSPLSVARGTAPAPSRRTS